MKEFAQMMVKDHAAYLDKVQKFTDEKGLSRGESRPENLRQPKEEKRPIIEEAKGDEPKEQYVGFRGDKHAAMEQIGKLGRRNASANDERSAQQYEGCEFDMAYVGQQIATHTQMLANLKAMEENTSGEFQTVVKEASKPPKTT